MEKLLNGIQLVHQQHLETRATVISNAPTTSVMSIISERDRHVIHFGTETTIGILQHKIQCLLDLVIKKIYPIMHLLQ
jgi:hypothetical protein